MTRPTAIALAGAVQAGRMFVAAVVLMAAIEAVSFAQSARGKEG